MTHTSSTASFNLCIRYPETRYTGRVGVVHVTHAPARGARSDRSTSGHAGAKLVQAVGACCCAAGMRGTRSRAEVLITCVWVGEQWGEQRPASVCTLVSRLTHKHAKRSSRWASLSQSLVVRAANGETPSLRTPATTPSRVAFYTFVGVMPLTAPCFSCAYFLRTACRLFVLAALCKALISRTHGSSAASE